MLQAELVLLNAVRRREDRLKDKAVSVYERKCVTSSQLSPHLPFTLKIFRVSITVQIFWSRFYRRRKMGPTVF